MSDEDWIRELANVNREQQREERDRLDERWDRLSGGELSPEEEAELRALAETSEEAREAYEAFRPLGPEFHASVVKAAAAEVASGAPEAEPREPRPRLLPFRRAASRTKVWLGTAAAALAAALLLFLRVPASLPPLPLYTAELSRGDQTFRGEPGPSTGLPVFRPGSLLTLDVSPQQPVAAGIVEAHGLVVRGEELVSLKPEPQVENNAVRLRGTLGQEIQLPPGERTIWIVVSRPGKSPSASDLQDILRPRRARQADWQAVCDDVTASPLRYDQWQVACVNLRVEDQPPS